MKTHILISLILSTLVLCTSCLSTAAKAEAKQMLFTAGKQLGKDLIAASAATTAELVDNQIAMLYAKLDAKEAALASAPDPTQTAKIRMQRASLRAGDKLAEDLQAVLVKVQDIDAEPPVPDAN